MERREHTVWTIEQTHEFLTAVQEHPRLKRDYLLWLTLFHTGLRPGECFGLQWRDLDGRRLRIQRAVSEGSPGEFLLKQPKTRQSVRSVVLTQQHAALLAAERAERAEEADTAHIFQPFTPGRYPFDNRTSARLRFASAIGTVNKARKDAEQEPLPIIRLYDARHSHATALLVTGVNPRVVSDRLGHTSVVITLDTYSAVLPSLQEDALGEYESRVKAANDSERSVNLTPPEGGVE
jgi:integrase